MSHHVNLYIGTSIPKYYCLAPVLVSLVKSKLKNLMKRFVFWNINGKFLQNIIVWKQLSPTWFLRWLFFRVFSLMIDALGTFVVVETKFSKNFSHSGLRSWKPCVKLLDGCSRWNNQFSINCFVANWQRKLVTGPEKYGQVIQHFH